MLKNYLRDLRNDWKRLMFSIAIVGVASVIMMLIIGSGIRLSLANGFIALAVAEFMPIRYES